VLEGDEGDDADDDSSGDEGEESMSDGEDAQSVAPAEAGGELAADLGDARGVNAGAARRDEAGGDDAGGDDAGDDEGEEEGAEGAEGGSAAAGAPGALGEDGRRRRRRRRRRGGSESAGEGGGRPPEASGDAASAGDGAFAGGGADAGGNGEPRATDAAIEAESQGPRRIMTPVDAAVEVLRGQSPGRGIAVRQIAETAARRRLVHGEPNEAWRVMRAALAAEPRERLRAGQRPRIKAAGAGLFALARRPPDAEVERAELVFAEARRALRERTLASLERRIAELPPPAFEALARVLLQREGFGPATFVKRIEETIYVEALRGRGARPSKALIALRSGGTTAGRRAVGELRAGIGKRGQDEGLLMLGGRLDGEAISEWKKAVPPVEIADGQAMAETCIRHGIGVISASVSVDFVDADFFAELSEG
jgi:Restriction endonuclease